MKFTNIGSIILVVLAISADAERRNNLSTSASLPSTTDVAAAPLDADRILQSSSREEEGGCVYVTSCKVIEVSKGSAYDGVYRSIHNDCSQLFDGAPWNSGLKGEWPVYKRLDTDRFRSDDAISWQQGDHGLGRWVLRERKRDFFTNENIVFYSSESHDLEWPALLPSSDNWFEELGVVWQGGKYVTRFVPFTVTMSCLPEAPYEDTAGLANKRGYEDFSTAASNECAARGQYLCSEKQICRARPANNPIHVDLPPISGYAPKGSNGWVVVLGEYGDRAHYMYVPSGPDDPMQCGRQFSNTYKTDSSSVWYGGYSNAPESIDLFSCCGEYFPGAPRQSTTKLIKFEFDELEGENVDFYKGTERSASSELASGAIYATAQVVMEVAADAGCESMSVTPRCEATFKVALIARARAGLQGEIANLGGVPVIGDVYVQVTAGSEAEGRAGCGIVGCSAESEGSVQMKGEVGVTITGDLGKGVEASASTTVEGGAEATYEGGVYATYNGVSAGAEVSAMAGARVEVKFGVEGDEGGAGGTASTCYGCVGAGFMPAMTFDSCSVTVGGSVSAALGVGFDVDVAASINLCSTMDSLGVTVDDVKKWGNSLFDAFEKNVISRREIKHIAGAIEESRSGEFVADAADVVVDSVLNPAYSIGEDIYEEVYGYFSGAGGCWGKGEVCGTRTTCHHCCTGNSNARCPWYQAGVCTCN